ncbi:MAG TPA: cation:proton antiporter [Acidimicrobiales bacterium]|jgi:Kef-type K+ transport system membrane component KefB
MRPVVALLTPQQVLGFVLLDVLVILVVARSLGALARRLGQPTVVGEIVAGVLLGPTLLGPTLFVWGSPPGPLHCDASLEGSEVVASIGNCLFPPQAKSVLGVIGQVALILYMFLVGAEVRHDMLKGKGRAIGLVAFGVIAVPVALGFVLGPVLYDAKWVAGFGGDAQPSQTAFSLMVGAILSVTAFPVMAHILQEKKLSTSPMGSVGIASTAALSVLMFLTVAVASSIARDASAGSIATTLVVAAVYLAVVFFVVRPALAPLGRRIEAAGRVDETAFGIIFVLVFASAYAADRIGINVIPGAFLIGVVLPARSITFPQLREKLRDLTLVVLLPVFLAFSGLNTDFTKLGISYVVGITLFLVAGIAGKWLAGAGFARLGGLSWAEGNVIGVLMNCRGLLVLVVALIALQDGVISGGLQVAAVLMALITTMMTGPLFDRFSASLPGAAAGPTVAEADVRPAGAAVP